MPNYYTTPSLNDSADLESKPKKVDTLETQIKRIDTQLKELETRVKQQKVIDIATAEHIKAIDKIFFPSSKEIAALEKIIKIKKIPIDYIAPALASSNPSDYAVVINYGGYDVAIGTKTRIIESYRKHAIESCKGRISSSNELLKLTVDMPCNRIIDSNWKKLLSNSSEVKFLSDDEIIDLYCSIRGVTLTGHFNFKHSFLKDSIILTKEKITIKTTAMDGDLILGKYVKDGRMDRMVTVLDSDGHEVVIGTTSEIEDSYWENYKKSTTGTVGMELFPEVVEVSKTKESIDSYWSNYNDEPPATKSKLSWASIIDHYCSYYYSERGTELVNSNFMVDEHEVAIDEASLSICSCPGLQRGEDVVDSNEHEAVIGATAQEHDICSY